MHRRADGRAGHVHSGADARIDKPFLMAIEDVFTIEGRGTVVTGRIERGVVKVGDKVRDRRPAGHAGDDRAPASKCSASCSTKARPATTWAYCSAARKRKTWSAVRCWPAPDSINPHTKFEVEVYVLSKEEGGRHTPFFSGYRPQFYFRTTDVTGAVKLLGGAEMCMPGDNVRLEVESIKPIAMDDRQPFRHPRRRQDGRFRRGDEDSRIDRLNQIAAGRHAEMCDRIV